MLVAILMAAVTTPQPWVEMQGGPAFIHQEGRSGVGTGPLLRLNLGYPATERLAGEVWLTGAMQNAPPTAPGDSSVLGGGLGGRFRLARFDEEGRLALWAHAGAGWSALTSGTGQSGVTGFGGALLSFQPFVQRFQIGLEADAVLFKNSFGGAVMPTLRCTF
jgi:hypothetical protein